MDLKPNALTTRPRGENSNGGKKKVYIKGSWSLSLIISVVNFVDLKTTQSALFWCEVSGLKYMSGFGTMPLMEISFNIIQAGICCMVEII